jgi:hypothetical protein
MQKAKLILPKTRDLSKIKKVVDLYFRQLLIESRSNYIKKGIERSKRTNTSKSN